MEITYVDAFTNEPFKGNPAAVTLLEGDLDDSVMQNIAAEINLSETAFLKKTAKGYSIRWWTPDGEVDLCGHATLASAHWLWESKTVLESEILFESKSGDLLAKKGSHDQIHLNFPLETPLQTDEDPLAIEKALGAKPLRILENRIDLFVEIEGGEAAIRNLKPDQTALKALLCRGIVVSSRGQGKGDYDFFSRAFFPKLGIAEDPVTGSAHCGLAPFWEKELGKTEFRAFQASKRGGEVGVKIIGNRVELTGSAITTIEAKIMVTLT